MSNKTKTTQIALSVLLTKDQFKKACEIGNGDVYKGIQIAVNLFDKDPNSKRQRLFGEREKILSRFPLTKKDEKRLKELRDEIDAIPWMLNGTSADEMNAIKFIRAHVTKIKKQIEEGDKP